MCGIAGILDPRRMAADLETSVSAMTAALHHRGPDAGGTWTDPEAGIALGHRRLSILDLSPLGAQPMHSPSGRWVISYNGEVFNFADLRAELQQLGFQFSGSSDTEVILAAVEAWGLDAAVRRFIGMFAFALWDRQERTLHLVRDRLGIKPLYWAQFGSTFLFGSELKALLACSGWEPGLDRNALAAYVRWNYVPTPHCIWQGAAKLAPGTRLEMTAGHPPRIATWWGLRDIVRTAKQSPFEGTDDDATDALENLLRDAVKRRMVADVPLGAFLSGGTDSSLVVALMQAQSDRPVRSFSIGFREREYDEAPFARAVAKHLGTQHTEMYVGPDDAMDLIPSLPDIYDEPFADSSQLPTYLVSRLTRQHVTVALSGDGGDEMFAGYTRYHWADMVARRFLPVPAIARGALAAVLTAFPKAFWETLALAMPAGRRPQRFSERVGKFSGFLRQPDADAIYRRQHSHWEEPNHLVLGGTEPLGVPFDGTLRRDLPDFVERMEFMDMVTYLPDDILTKVDRASMAVALEARVPLLDHRVVEFSWRLPRHLKVRQGQTKWLLRQVLYRHVPRELIERPKMGFAIPLGRWLRGDLRDWAEGLLGARRLQEAGIFDAAVIRTAWTRFLAGHNVDQEALWGVLMFEAWRDRYMGVSRTAHTR